MDIIVEQEPIERSAEKDITSPELREILDPKKVAVLVIDKQRSYCDPNEVLPKLLQTDTEELQEMLPRLDEFIQEARGRGIEVIWTRMIEDPNLSEDNVRWMMRYTDTPPISTPHTPGFEYIGMKPNPNEKEIVKKTYDAFTKTQLDEYLKSKGITTVVVTGAYASVCVYATSLGAFGRDYFVVTPKDLVGVPRIYAHHPPVIHEIHGAILGPVTNSETLINIWESYTKPT